MLQISKDKVNFLIVQSEESGQRIDNYLQKKLKGVPKSHIQKIIRSGEVRINKKRIHSNSKIYFNDQIRVPPIRMTTQNTPSNFNFLTLPIIYEDDVLLVINKPAGIAVHGGSGINFGVIEQLRKQRTESKYLELIHRLDKDTSGLLMIAKKRKALIHIQEQFRQNHLQKIYLALSINPWNQQIKNIELPLTKYHNPSGEKIVKIDPNGQYAHTQFEILENFQQFSLLKISLKTGRTHQIRVHMQSQNAPIAGDEKYGNFAMNKQLQKIGLKRMFLHAFQLNIQHPNNVDSLNLQAPLPETLNIFLEKLKKRTS